MRAYEILFEYNREKTVQNYGNKLIDTMMQDAGVLFQYDKTGDKLKKALEKNLSAWLETFETFDPTKNKQYTQWIINRYIKQDFQIGHLEMVKKYLEKFIEATKQKLVQNRDLNSYTFDSLKKIINEIYSSKVSGNVSNNDSKTKSDNTLYPTIPGTRVLYNGPRGQLVIPETLAASQALQKIGHKTAWCTADSRSARHFQDYNKGPLYVWISADGSKYQFYFPTMEFMDERNDELQDLDLIKFFKNNSVTASIFNSELKTTLKTWGGALSIIPPQLRTPELCKLAVTDGRGNLADVPPPLRTPELYKLAITSNGAGLYHVPAELRTPELYKLAVTSNGDALQYVPAELRTPELYKLAVTSNGSGLQYIPTKLRTPELCELAVTSNGEALHHVPDQLRTLRLCKIAIEKDGRALVYVPKPLRTPELCKIAVTGNAAALVYVPESLRTAELCKLAIERYGNALQSVPESLRTPELCKIAVTNDGSALMSVPEELRTPELCLLAIKNEEHALNYVPQELQIPEFYKLAVKQNIGTLEYVPEHLQQQIKQELNIKY